MKTLSLWQPWGSLIAGKAKLIETRSWSDPYRGYLAIHAAKRFTPEEKKWALLFAYTYPSASKILLDEMRLLKPMDLGCVICICKLTDIVPVEVIRDSISDDEFAYGNYNDNRYAWILEHIHTFEKPIPATGRQRLWNWDEGDTILKKLTA